jgi:hypothetical protein
MSDLLFWLLTNAGLSAVTAGVVATVAIFVLRNAVKSSIEEGVKFGFAKALEERKAQLTQEIEAAKTSLKFSETRFSKNRGPKRAPIVQPFYLFMKWQELGCSLLRFFWLGSAPRCCSTFSKLSCQARQLPSSRARGRV